MAHITKRSEGVAFACGIAFSLEESLEKFRGIWNQGLRVMVYGRHSKDGVFSHVSVSMLQTCSGWREQRLNQLRLAELAKKAQCVAPDVFVRMLQVASDAIAT